MRIFSSIGSSSMLATTRAISRSLERLSSGRRVNSANDDVASFSAGVRAQSQIRGLTQGLQGLNAGKSLLAVADSALSSQIDLVQRMREIAIEASSGTLTSANRSQLNQELQGLISEYERLANSTEFNSQSLLDGSLGTISLASGLTSNDALEFNLDSSRGVDTFERTIGNGVFTRVSTSTHSSTFNISNAELADLNNDGKLDAVLQNWSGATLSILLGNGDGTFQSERTVGPTYASQTSIADLDGDGNLDLVTQNYTSTFFSVFMGNGDGTFDAARTYASAINSQHTAVGDVDNDGDQDIITQSNTGGFAEIYLNNGSGVFAASQCLDVIGITGDLDVFDVNNDGINDIVNASSDQTNVQIHYGTGHGQFSSPTNIFFGAGGGYQVEIADVNGDGRNDILQGSAGTLRLSIQNSDGSFGSATAIATTGNVSDLRAIDMDDDGDIDLVWGNYSTNNVNVLYGYGNGTFAPIQTLTGSGAAAVGDLNGDGLLDIFTRNGAASTQSFAYLQGNQDVVALADLDVRDQTSATRMLSVLDTALETLSSRRSDISALHTQLDARVSANLLLAENLEDYRSRLEDVDIAEETATLVRNQILQQAQIAVRAQANLQMQVVLNLLKF